MVASREKPRRNGYTISQFFFAFCQVTPKLEVESRDFLGSRPEEDSERVLARPILKSTALTSPFFSSQVQVPPRVRAAHHARASSSRTPNPVGTRSEVAHRVVRQLSSPRAGASRRRIALHAPFSECRVASGTHRATRRSLKFP